MQESQKRDTIEFSKKAKVIREFLNVKSNNFNSTVVDAAIKAVMRNDRDAAKTYLLRKIEMDAKGDHKVATLAEETGEETADKKPTSEYIAEQIVLGIEMKLEEIKEAEKNTQTQVVEQPDIPEIKTEEANPVTVTSPENNKPEEETKTIAKDSTGNIPEEYLSDTILNKEDKKETASEKYGAINVRTDDKIEWGKEPIIPKRTESSFAELTTEEKARYTKVEIEKPKRKSKGGLGKNALTMIDKSTSANSEKLIGAIADKSLEESIDKLKLDWEKKFETAPEFSAYTTEMKNQKVEEEVKKLKDEFENKPIEDFEENKKNENLKSRDQLALEKAREVIQKLKEKQSQWDPNATDYEKIAFLKKTFQELNIPVASIEPVYTAQELAEKEKAKIAYEEREKIIMQIGDMLKAGIDKIVIHGQTKEIGDDVSVESKFGQSIDADTRGALYFLSLAKGVTYNEGAYTRLTHKGGRGSGEETEFEYTIPESKFNKGGEEGTAPVSYHNTKEVKDRTKLYIDTSGEKISFKIDEKGKAPREIFIDHHQKYFSKYETSATELMYEVLVKNKMIDAEPWMDNMVRCITSEDNLSYVNDKRFTEGFLEHKWPESIFGVHKDVPFEKVTQWFKEGKDPFKPDFTDEELKETFNVIEWDKIDKKKSKIVQKTLEKIIESKDKEIGADISNTKFAVKLMESRGIKTESKLLGKVVYNKQDVQEDINKLRTTKVKNPKNYINNGFLATKALGYDTYVTYNEKYHRFMINTNTKNLMPLYEKIKKIIPEVVLVRGVMLMQPTGLSKRKAMTEEKLLKLLGLI